MKQEQKRGFSLVEIMVVIAIIMVLTVILIPNMIRSKMVSNESLTITACKTIANACNLYANDNDVYPPTLSSLANENPPYIDPKYASTNSSYINGYQYIYTRIDESNFKLTATARNAISGSRCFFVDETSVVRACNGYNCTPDEDAPPIG